MGFGKVVIALIILGGINAALFAYLCPDFVYDREPPKLQDEYWGKGKLPEDVTKFPKDNPSINKYTIHVEDAVLKDLKQRLNNTRFVEPLDNVQFQYGFRATYLKDVVEYWKTKYDWRKHEKELNKFNHFTTQIEGINIHFIHQKPELKGKKVRTIPLLLLHGWPGSIVEFQKIIPMLTTPKEGRDYVFEVISPSLPGYGFSEAPHQPGFSLASAARVLTKLMTRLGYTRFYVQGGDYGSMISGLISSIYPEKIEGAHFNLMPGMRVGVFGTLKLLAGSIFPNLFFNEIQQQNLYPLKKKFLDFLQESGYFHIQATKPDTVGSALTDSPAGLAAYILEKFSTGTDKSHRELEDGGLTKKFTLDELLTNVMVYWCNNNIASSQRYYKEIFGQKYQSYKMENVPIKVPAGVANFPHEILTFPRCLMTNRLRNIVRFKDMPRGGHFAAFEEPQLLAEEIWDFVVDVEASRKKQQKQL